MENERIAPSVTLKEWAVLMTLVINFATLLLHADIKAMVSSGWNWLYFLSFCILTIYVLDLFRRVKRWANGIVSIASAAQIGLDRAVKDHMNIMDAKTEAFEAKMTIERSEWRRTFAETVEDVVRYKANLATVEKEANDRAAADGEIILQLKAIEARLPPVGAT